jgi:hypothetical protein
VRGKKQSFFCIREKRTIFFVYAEKHVFVRAGKNNKHFICVRGKKPITILFVSGIGLAWEENGFSCQKISGFLQHQLLYKSIA